MLNLQEGNMPLILPAGQVNTIKGGSEMERNRAYRRRVRKRKITRRKRIWKEFWGSDWDIPYGKFAKYNLGCGCWLCKPWKHYNCPDKSELIEADHVKQCLDDYFGE